MERILHLRAPMVLPFSLRSAAVVAVQGVKDPKVVAAAAVPWLKKTTWAVWLRMVELQKMKVAKVSMVVLEIGCILALAVAVQELPRKTRINLWMVARG